MWLPRLGQPGEGVPTVTRRQLTGLPAQEQPPHERSRVAVGVGDGVAVGVAAGIGEGGASARVCGGVSVGSGVAACTSTGPADRFGLLWARGPGVSVGVAVGGSSMAAAPVIWVEGDHVDEDQVVAGVFGWSVKKKTVTLLPRARP